jgi:chromosome segregation ATPase
LKDKNIRKLTKRNKNLETDLKRSENSARENLEYANKSDNDRLDLITKLELLSKTIESLKHDVKDRDIVIENFKKDVNERQLLEDHLKADAANYMMVIQDLTNTKGDLQNELQLITKDYRDLKEESEIERSNLMLSLENHEREGERTKAIIGDLQRLHKETSEAFTHSQLMNESKILGLNDEIDNLRNESRKHDIEMRDAVSLMKDYESKMEDLRGQLKSATETISDMTLNYQTRVKEIDMKHEEMKIGYATLENDNLLLHSEIKELKATQKRYEYEIDLLSEKNHQQIEEFVKTQHNIRSEHTSARPTAYRISTTREQREEQIAMAKSLYGKLDNVTSDHPAINSKDPRESKAEMRTYFESKYGGNSSSRLDTLNSPQNVDPRLSTKARSGQIARNFSEAKPDHYSDDTFARSDQDSKIYKPEDYSFSNNEGGKVKNEESTIKSPRTSTIKNNTNASVENIQKEIQKLASTKNQIKETIEHRTKLLLNNMK